MAVNPSDGNSKLGIHKELVYRRGPRADASLVSLDPHREHQEAPGEHDTNSEDSFKLSVG
jgi:hypothetical protein